MRTLLAAFVLLFSAGSAQTEPVRCAWVNSADDTIVKFQMFEGACPPSRLHKGIKWLPALPVSLPSFDPETQVMEGPNHAVGPSQVTQSYTVRAKTAQEVDDGKTFTVNRINKAVIKVLCRLENHDRVSDGKAALTETQCRNAFKGLL